MKALEGWIGSNLRSEHSDFGVVVDKVINHSRKKNKKCIHGIIKPILIKKRKDTNRKEEKAKPFNYS